MAQTPVQEQDVFGRQLNSKDKKKSQIWRKVGISALALTGVAGAYFAFTKSGRQRLEDGTNAIKVGITVQQNPDLLFQNVGHDHVNVLVVGEDYNWKVDKVLNPRTGKFAPMQVVDTDSPPRSDTMIVMSLNRVDGTLRMLSMPRDARITYVDLDGDRHRRRKLNSVYSTGGADPETRQRLLRQVIGEELGIRIDRIAVIKPRSFKKLVDMVGGVEVNVDGALKLDRKTGKLYRGHIYYKDNWGQWEVDLDPGQQWLNGEQAHGYVRFRKDREGDPGRIRRQQDVMKALAKRIMTKPIWELPGLAKQIRQEFRTDMTDEELGSLALFAKNHGLAGKIQPLTLYGVYASNGDIILNRPKNEKLLPVIFGSSFNAEKFLVQSPSTKGDDIGPANNASPGIQALLRRAGLIDGEEVRSASSSDSGMEVRQGEESPAERTSRRRRLASADDSESASSGESAAEEQPRRRRRIRRERREEPVAASEPRSEPAPAEPEPQSASEAPAVESVTESPVPQAEPDAAPVAEPPVESPIPQPE